MLHVQLFGRFGARLDSRAVRVREGSKAQELLVYLLLNRERPHARESVACLLWDECSAEHSRSYLRKTLWQVHTALCPREGCGCPLLRVDPRWVQVDPEAELWLDVAAFEGAHERTRGVPGRALDAPAARALADAVALYGGGLMLDCYEEWCLVARERLRHLQLVMLDKLMDYGEAHGDCEQALLYGMEILSHDTAREHTHRQMMRLHQLHGDRTGALRQYRACVEVLDAELGVGPMPETVALFEQIRGDAAPAPLPPCVTPETSPPPGDALDTILASLGALHTGLAEVRRQTESIAVALHAGDAPRA